MKYFEVLLERGLAPLTLYCRLLVQFGTPYVIPQCEFSLLLNYRYYHKGV